MSEDIQLPGGYRFAGTACGIKKSGGKDISLVVSDNEAVAAAVYTQNIVFAAPVEYDRKLTPSRACRAVVVNSGNANACTGQRGLDDCLTMAQRTAEGIGAKAEQVLVMSTGIIGEFLPMEKIEQGIALAAQSLENHQQAFIDSSDGILTTDIGRKVGSRSVVTSSGPITICGMAKGAGMIGPNMATMLATILTDARLSPETAQALIQSAVDRSFNRISVEGHTSTNDTVILLANGHAEFDLSEEELGQFADALTELCIDLAKMIPTDGEGAKHLIEIRVRGMESDQHAEQIARTVAQSALVKTGIAGNDPNWGRIVSAAGYAGVPFPANDVRLQLNGTLLYEKGAPTPFDPATVSKSMADTPITLIELDFTAGEGSCVFWTSDLTVEYVRFNSEYHT